MNNQELISKLKFQHAGLKEDLGAVLHNADFNSENAAGLIASGLGKFQTDLLEHLKLEDIEFYPAYFKKLHHDEEPARKLMAQMADIIKSVNEFLKKYESETEIIAKQGDFKTDLTKIISVLMTRIETEEEGIYDLFLI